MSPALRLRIDAPYPRSSLLRVGLKALLGADSVADFLKVPDASVQGDRQVFEVQVPAGVGIGGDTRLGELVLEATEGGDMRLTLPASWADALALALPRDVEIERAVDHRGRAVGRLAIEAHPGLQLRIPVPVAGDLVIGCL